MIDAMDLALQTGQRPADVLKIERTYIRDGTLWMVQNKTEAPMGREITGNLVAICHPKTLAFNPYCTKSTR